MKEKISKGRFGQFGAVSDEGAVEFTFSVKTDEQPAVLLYQIKDKKPLAQIDIPGEYCIGEVYSVRIKGFSPKNTCYLLKRDGKVELDPYAPVIIGREKWMNEDRKEDNYKVYGGFASQGYKFSAPSVGLKPEDMIIYKLHMRGYTMAGGLTASKRGNYRGIIQRLSSLKELGITTLEFMPIYDFEEISYKMHLSLNANLKSVMMAGEPDGTNYWGYGSASYFAPKSSYFGGSNPDIHMKEMVDAIHSNGMEIVMEMSFGPEADNDLIISALIYWVREYRIDGFHLLGMNIPIKRIASNPYLGKTKIFYEDFPQEVLSAQRKDNKHLFFANDDYVYPLRRLQNHIDGTIAEFTNFVRRQGDNYTFVNYAASNTGFTLWDAYSYGEKHNFDNGEDNTDGNNYNCSHNHGCEGETANRIINANRISAVRTALAAVMLSQSVPMILAGDEIANTQQGNNNPYCQDNEIGWVTFSRRKAPKLLREYVKHLIAFRKSHTVLSLPMPMRMNDYKHTGIPDLSYHGREPWIMGIGDEKKALGILYNSAYAKNEDEEDVMLCLNFYYGEETFALPRLKNGRKWYLVTNTLESEWKPCDEPIKNQSYFGVPGGSISILVGR